MDELTISKIVYFILLILSLTFHEYGHAWSAKKLGDDTAERMGRLTLNPIVHLDPIFTVLLPLMMLFGPLQGSNIGICAAKPVPVVPWNMRKPLRDMMLTSAAGPAMNVVLALFFTAAYWFHTELRGIDPFKLSSLMLLQAIRLNLQLAFFNMLPIPPLDGHRVLGYFLPRGIRETYYRIGAAGGLMLLLALMYFGVLARINDAFLVPFGRWWGAMLMPGDLPIFY
ncbi:MAG: site-2 protease family protein [Planctomycetes bacterium]|nr:site-2 protease family protein [Planctomycetota bacterium]